MPLPPPPVRPDPDHVPTERELREDLAAAYRLVALYGMTDLVFTHLSVRLPGEGHRFLVNPYGMLFEEITASSLVEVDAEGAPAQADRLAGEPRRLRHPFGGASRPRRCAPASCTPIPSPAWRWRRRSAGCCR